ncbi:MAG: hypothetical protein JW807_15110 [Spirochaetes bacterium]|nr:hypothetical protein [Spirochaetota bacterium]
MKILKKVTALVVVGSVIMIAIACKKGNLYVDQLAVLSKRACGCADKKCAEDEFKNFMVIVADMKKTDAKVTNEEGQKLGEHTATIIKCLMTKGLSPITVQQELQKFR